MRTGKSTIERAVQFLFPMELSCDKTPPNTTKALDPNAESFRPQRVVAVKAVERIRNIAAEKKNEF